MTLDLSILNIVAKIWCLLLVHLLLVSVVTGDWLLIIFIVSAHWPFWLNFTTVNYLNWVIRLVLACELLIGANHESICL